MSFRIHAASCLIQRLNERNSQVVGRRKEYSAAKFIQVDRMSLRLESCWVYLKIIIYIFVLFLDMYICIKYVTWSRVRVKISNSKILEWLIFRIWKLTNVQM